MLISSLSNHITITKNIDQYTPHLAAQKQYKTYKTFNYIIPLLKATAKHNQTTSTRGYTIADLYIGILKCNTH